MHREPRRIVLVIAGTRPECIKLASVAETLRRSPHFTVVVLNSGQHPLAVNGTFDEFGIRCDLTLMPLPPLPNLLQSVRHLERQLRGTLQRVMPSMVVVQGDTLTAFCAARTTRASGIPCVHVEAGLRTESAGDPFPEEWFRRRISRHADVHFAPTQRAAQNLLAEGVDASAVHVIGNTGIDALASKMPKNSQGDGGRGFVLVTLHRRENWDRNADHVCEALLRLVALQRGLHVVFAVHPNPVVASRIAKHLSGEPSIRLVPPMTYSAFLRCAAGARLIISDSGGIQEEAAHLGTPLLVPRRNTERPEALATSFVRLVDVSEGPQALVDAAVRTLDEPLRAPLPIDRHAPFGDGHAARRLLGILTARQVELGYA